MGREQLPVFSFLTQTVCNYEGKCSLLVWSPNFMAECSSSSKHGTNAVFYKRPGLIRGFGVVLVQQWVYFLWGKEHQRAFSLHWEC